MAIDRYLLEQHRLNQHPPTIRFYTWKPAAISLGYHQKDYPPAWNDLTWQGQPIDIVRRPTGGRAVLHQGDLTYGIVTSIPPGKRLEVYKQICQFVITGWRLLGVELDYGRSTKEYIQHDNCFATATGSDLITTAGNKVIGSAQLRRGKAILQHGSMMLDTNPNLYRQVFGVELKQNLLEVIPTPQDRTTRPISNHFADKILHRLTEAAIATFKIDLAEQPLSDKEWQDMKNDFSL